MTPYNYFAWEWIDENGIPRYVGYGKMTKRKHPAERLWDARFGTKSHLNEWLLTCRAEPTRSDALPRMLMHRDGARAACYARRKKLKQEGLELLTTRPFGSTLGGGAKKAVINPDGLRFSSVRSAAEILGLNQGTITRKCNNPKSKWRYEHHANHD